MKVTESSLPGVLLVEPKVFGDDRGFFMETFHEERYREAGIGVRFVQDNLSRSIRGTVRGLHYQFPVMQAKLVQVLEGSIRDVVVDIRPGSPTFGRSVRYDLDAGRAAQVYVPEGYAHGFAVLSESALVAYRCSALYDPAGQCSIRWDDPALGIDWGVTDPVLSGKDAAAPLLADLPPERLPAFAG